MQHVGMSVGDPFQTRTPDVGEDGNRDMHSLIFTADKPLDKHQVQVVPDRMFSLGPYVPLPSVGDPLLSTCTEEVFLLCFKE